MNAWKLFWHLISATGSSIVTLPIALALAIWLSVSGERKPAVHWCFLFGLAMVLVAATKIAFIGWGIGIEQLDFTGLSGHATRAALVFPVLFYFGLQRHPRTIFSLPLYFGVALGLLVAISRVKVHAHSISEIVSGWLLGSAACATFLFWIRTHAMLTSRRWLVTWSFAILCLSPLTRHSTTSSESMVESLALFLSGHKEPFVRQNWHSEHGSGGHDLVEQIGVTIQQFEQLDQSQRRPGFAVFVAREGIDASAEDFGGLALIKLEFLANVADEVRIDDSRIHLSGEGAHFAHDTG